VLKADLAALEKARPNIPDAPGAAEGDIAETLRIHVRGNPQTLGAEVPKRFPRIFAGENQPPLPAKQSGRLQLAEWLTRPDHPLTARVMANRIWRWHFGAGIVGTTDNFGLLGEKPSHPELLDWLALEFVKQKWSIKAMHRTMLLSATYQMSCVDSVAAESTDPENRLHWRFARQRLDAESMRDAILSVSGQIDLTLGGSLVKGKDREYVSNDKSVESFVSKRRSIYLPVIRTAGYDVFQAFDFPDPCVACGNRSTTTVAPQALFMLNGEVVVSNAQKMGEWLVKQSGDDAARVRSVYLRAFARSPNDAETKRALAFVAEYTGSLEKTAAKPGDTDARARLAGVLSGGYGVE